MIFSCFEIKGEREDEALIKGKGLLVLQPMGKETHNCFIFYMFSPNDRELIVLFSLNNNC